MVYAGLVVSYVVTIQDSVQETAGCRWEAVSALGSLAAVVVAICLGVRAMQAEERTAIRAERYGTGLRVLEWLGTAASSADGFLPPRGRFGYSRAVPTDLELDELSRRLEQLKSECRSIFGQGSKTEAAMVRVYDFIVRMKSQSADLKNENTRIDADAYSPGLTADEQRQRAEGSRLELFEDRIEAPWRNEFPTLRGSLEAEVEKEMRKTSRPKFKTPRAMSATYPGGSADQQTEAQNPAPMA